MDREKARRKVLKLLRLSKSSNRHEAAAALRQAQTLMREHELREADIEDEDYSPNSVGESPDRERRSRNPPVYAVALAKLVANCFGCEVILGASDSRHRFIFVGTSFRRKIAVYTFDVLLRQLDRDRRTHISRVRKASNRASRGDAFGIGWVQGVKDVLSPWQLDDHERELLREHLNWRHPNLRQSEVKARSSKAVDLNDISRGRLSGEQARLHRGVAGAKQAQIAADPDIRLAEDDRP